MTVQLIDILSVIQSHSLISTEELAEMFGVTSSKMRNKLYRLLRQGYIKRTSEKPSHWVLTKGACEPKKPTKPSQLRMIERDGRTMCLKDWCRELGLSYNAVLARLHKGGWSIEEALDTPIGEARVKE